MSEEEQIIVSDNLIEEFGKYAYTFEGMMFKFEINDLQVQFCIFKMDKEFKISFKSIGFHSVHDIPLEVKPHMVYEKWLEHLELLESNIHKASMHAKSLETKLRFGII